jgi:hypothetical protein
LLGSGAEYPFSSFPSESCTNLFWGGEWFPSLFHLPIIPLGAVSVPVFCNLVLANYSSKHYETKKEKEEKERKKKKEIENQRILQGVVVY